MPNSLSAETIEAVEARVEKIRTDFKERHEEDRAHLRSITARLSWAVGIAFTVFAYLGYKGFDDLVDRAVQRANAKEKWEAVLENVRDHALVHSLTREREFINTPYTSLETEAFRRLLQSRETRNQMFADVITLLKTRKRLIEPLPMLEAITEIIKTNDKLDWRKQEILISYLAEQKHSSASDVVLTLLNSPKHEVQLAAIKYLRDCDIRDAVGPLSKLMRNQIRGRVQSTAAIALLSLDGNNSEARKWLSEIKNQATQSLEQAAAALDQIAVITDVVSRRTSTDAAQTSPIAQRNLRNIDDPALRPVVDILRTILLNNYILTVAYDGGRRLIYVAQDENRYSEMDISETLLSNYLVNSLLRNQLQSGNSMDGFKRLVRGLSGIVTKRTVQDVRQQVIFFLGAGDIEFSDGSTASPRAGAETQNIDQAIVAGWSTRSWKLFLNGDGELTAESTSPVARAPGGKEFNRKVKMIKMAEGSEFRLAPVREDEMFLSTPLRSLR